MFDGLGICYLLGEVPQCRRLFAMIVGLNLFGWCHYQSHPKHVAPCTCKPLLIGKVTCWINLTVFKSSLALEWHEYLLEDMWTPSSLMICDPHHPRHIFYYVGQKLKYWIIFASTHWIQINIAQIIFILTRCSLYQIIYVPDLNQKYQIITTI